MMDVERGRTARGGVRVWVQTPPGILGLPLVAAPLPPTLPAFLIARRLEMLEGGEQPKIVKKD